MDSKLKEWWKHGINPYTGWTKPKPINVQEGSYERVVKQIKDKRDETTRDRLQSTTSH